VLAVDLFGLAIRSGLGQAFLESFHEVEGRRLFRELQWLDLQDSLSVGVLIF